MEKQNNPSCGPPDFSEPWKLSNLVLVVEEQRFHVHRGTLAFWSPVFERMLTSDFKEKNLDEIPLPGKKASEVKELLQIMYPSLEEKVITRNNCYFLLDLAREYQIASITRKCEDFLVSAVETRRENDVLAELIVGQNYELQTLINSCVREARRLSLQELKYHTKRGEIETDYYVKITEGIIERLEKQCKEVKASCSRNLLNSSRCLYDHVRTEGGVPSPSYALGKKSRASPSTYEYLHVLSKENSYKKFSPDQEILRTWFSELSSHLMQLKRNLETLP